MKHNFKKEFKRLIWHPKCKLFCDELIMIKKHYDFRIKFTCFQSKYFLSMNPKEKGSVKQSTLKRNNHL